MTRSIARLSAKAELLVGFSWQQLKPVFRHYMYAAMASVADVVGCCLSRWFLSCASCSRWHHVRRRHSRSSHSCHQLNHVVCYQYLPYSWRSSTLYAGCRSTVYLLQRLESQVSLYTLTCVLLSLHSYSVYCIVAFRSTQHNTVCDAISHCPLNATHFPPLLKTSNTTPFKHGLLCKYRVTTKNCKPLSLNIYAVLKRAQIYTVVS